MNQKHSARAIAGFTVLVGAHAADFACARRQEGLGMVRSCGWFMKRRLLTLSLLVLLLPVTLSATTEPGPFLYLATQKNSNFLEGNVLVYNLRTNTWVAGIRVGAQTEAIAVTPDATKAYAVNNTSISVIDTNTNSVSKTIVLSGQNDPGLLQNIAITPDGSRAYVCGYYGNGLTANGGLAVINVKTDTVTGIIPVPGNPTGIAFAPATNRAYVSLSQATAGIDRNNGVAIIDTITNTEMGRIPFGFQANCRAITLSPDGTRAYVANLYNPNSSGTASPYGSVTIIDTTTNAAITTITPNIPTYGSTGIAVSPDGSRTYVTTYTGFVWLIDNLTNTFNGQVGRGAFPSVSGGYGEGSGIGDSGIVFSPDGRYVYASAAQAPYAVAVIDPNPSVIQGPYVAQGIPSPFSFGIAPKGLAIADLSKANVSPPPTATIASSPASPTCKVGSTVTLTANVSGGTAPFAYSWKKNGVAFGGNTASISDTSVLGTTPYSVTVTDSSGRVSNTAQFNMQGWDFTVTVTSPTNAIWNKAASPLTGYTVAVQAVAGSAGADQQPIALNTTGAPAGVTINDFPSSLTIIGGTASANFSLKVSPMTPLGDLHFSVVGTSSAASGSCAHTSAPPADIHVFDITRAVTNPDNTVLRGNSTTYNCTVTLVSGSTTIGLPTITHTVSGLPSDATRVFNPDPKQLASPSVSFTLTVQTGATSLGDFPFTVTGTNVDTGGSVSGTGRLHIFDYAVSVQPPSDKTVLRGSSASYTMNVSTVSGSTALNLPNVNLSVSGAPGDASVTLPVSVALNSTPTLMIATAANGSLGDFQSLTVTGMIPNVSNSARSGPAALHIFDYRVNFKPPNDIRVCRGMTGAYTLAVELTQGSTGAGLPTNVALSVTSTPPTDATLTLNQSSLPFPTAGSSSVAQLTVATTATTTLGDFNLNVAATIPGGSRSTSDPMNVSGVLRIVDPVTITQQPQSATKCVGESITFSVTATGTAPLSYQWRKNGTNISGATGSSLTIASVATGDAGTYDVVVTNVCGPVTSAPATLTVIVPVTVSLSASPSTPVCSKDTVTLTASASGGSGQFSYAWSASSPNAGLPRSWRRCCFRCSTRRASRDARWRAPATCVRWAWRSPCTCRTTTVSTRARGPFTRRWRRPAAETAIWTYRSGHCETT